MPAIKPIESCHWESGREFCEFDSYPSKTNIEWDPNCKKADNGNDEELWKMMKSKREENKLFAVSLLRHKESRNEV
ncbi:MAG TPA: hypothetical protein VHM26_10870 [Chitinophagaceae bacterium]|jgi:hypothetical protein|nr:hypothetical protein [Chitinophagaceae bacterium]